MTSLKAIPSDSPAQETSVPLSGFDVNEDLYRQMESESHAMAKYALSNGLEVAPNTIAELFKSEKTKLQGNLSNTANGLAAVHQTLGKIVAPATPRAILLLDKERIKKPLCYFLGPIPLVRRLSATAIFFLVGLLLISLSPSVNVENINKGMLSLERYVLFLNQLFLLCCAGLGASFSSLFQLNRFIANATYDPRFDSSYWSRIILGVIAGIIMIELLPASVFSEGSTMHSFGKPTLAMFGGFSATVVYRIIQRLVDSLETLVKGPQRDNREQQKVTVKAQTAEQRAQVNAEVAAALINLQKDLDSNESKEARNKVGEVIQTLLPGKGDTRSTS